MKNRNKALLLFLFLSLIITAVLFRGGSLLGGGEAGILFYDPSRLLALTSNTWQNVYLGVYVGHSLTNIFFFGFLTFLQNIGVSGVIQEAGFFFLIIFLSLFSAYKFTRELFPQSPKQAAVFSALFYQFNLYSMMNIWNRFLLNMMLFYAILPLLLWLYIKGLKEKQYKYSAVIALISVLFTYAFSSPGHVIIFWLIVGFTTIYYYLFFSKKNKFAIKYFLTTLIVWVFANSWWILQQIYFSFSSFFQTTTNLFFSPSGNQEALNSLSSSLGKIFNIYLLRHGTFFTFSEGYPFNWPHFYDHPIVLILMWSVILVVLVMSIKRIANQWVVMLLTLFTLGLFLSKGNAPPFGEIFNFVFSKFAPFQFFRNAFEKLGLLLPLSLAPLFGFAMASLLEKLKGNAIKFARYFVWFYLLVLMGFPFWTGLIHTSNMYPSNDPKVGIQVDVPEYYKEANDWLKEQNEEFRLAVFPISGEGIFYNWSKGYSGVEQSSLFFTNQVVAQKADFPFYNNVSAVMDKLFVTYFDFYKAAGAINAKYLLFRPDIDYKLSQTRDPQEVGQVFDRLAGIPGASISFVKKFGPLKLYELSEEVFRPKIYAPNSITLVDNHSTLEDIYFSENTDEITLVHELDRLEGFETILHNSRVFSIEESLFPKYSEAPYIFPHVSRLPSSKYYQATLLKEKFELAARFRIEDRAEWNILLLGKRLLEAKRSLEAHDTLSASIALRLYSEKFDEVMSQIQFATVTIPHPNEQVWKEAQLFETFSSHLYLINQIMPQANELPEIVRVREKFKKGVSNLHIIPYFDLFASEKFPIERRIVFSFEIESPGDYEVMIPKNSLFPSKFEVEDILFIQIDDRVENAEISLNEVGLSFGQHFFEVGTHEIGFNQPTSENLVQSDEAIELFSETEGVSKGYVVDSFDPYSSYDISFDYWTKYGDGPQFAISLNTDLAPDAKMDNYFYSRKLIEDYLFDFQTHYYELEPDSNSSSARLIFNGNLWSNCERLNSSNPAKCSDKEFRKPYERPSYNIIKNLSVTPKVPGQMIIRKKGDVKLSVPAGIAFEKLSSSKYKVAIKGADEKYLLVFSELFSPDWKVYPLEENGTFRGKFWETWGRESKFSDNHLLVNNYANGWIIDKKGDYELIVEFWPQRLLFAGYIVSGLAIMAGLVLLVKNK